MTRLLTFALAAIFLANNPACAQPAPPVSIRCDAGGPAAGSPEPNLHGQWDFLMVPRGMPSFGLMSIGFVGAEYGGSLAPTRTAPVVLRKVSVAGRSVQLVVASTEGDVRFDGQLSAKGDVLCGTVTYHGGETFPMVAHKRPMAYQSASPAERARR